MDNNGILKGWNDIFNQTLEKMKKEAEGKHGISTLRGYRSFMKIGDSRISDIIGKAITSLQRDVNELIPDNIEMFQHSNSRGFPQRTLAISKARFLSNMNNRKLEESLERSIVASTSEYLFNQFNLLSGINNTAHQGKRASVDFIDLREKNYLRIIELKQWGNHSDSPICSLLEVVSYYFAFLKIIHIEPTYFKDSLNRYGLFVLAPVEYYEYWRIEPEKIDFIEKTANKYLTTATNNDVLFNYKKLEIKRDIFVDMIRGVADTYGNISDVNKEIIKNTYLNSINSK